MARISPAMTKEAERKLLSLQSAHLQSRKIPPGRKCLYDVDFAEQDLSYNRFVKDFTNTSIIIRQEFGTVIIRTRMGRD